MDPSPIDRSQLPIITSTTPSEPVHILLVNPNSTPSMTSACLQSLSSSLPPNTSVSGFTAPPPSPSAIESHSDAVLSAATCLKVLIPLINNTGFDGVLVACYSAHPLIPALREETSIPVLGIMEASLYASRMLGSRFGIVATGGRSKLMQEEAIRGYGLSSFYVGSENTVGVLELESREQGEVLDAVGNAAKRLVERGADCVALGCAGMVGMRERCKEVVGCDGEVMVVDGVGVGVGFLVALVRERLRTPKGGVFRSAAEGRRRRGQNWI